MKTLTYGNLVASVSNVTRLTWPHLTREQVEHVMRSTFRVVAEFSENRRVSIPGFGVFTRRTRKARTVRNPQTKQLMQLPETSTLGFRAAKAFKRGSK